MFISKGSTSNNGGVPFLLKFTKIWWHISAHLSDNYVDLSAIYVNLSDHYVDLSEKY